MGITVALLASLVLTGEAGNPVRNSLLPVLAGVDQGPMAAGMAVMVAVYLVVLIMDFMAAVLAVTLETAVLLALEAQQLTALVVLAALAFPVAALVFMDKALLALVAVERPVAEALALFMVVVVAANLSLAAATGLLVQSASSGPAIFDSFRQHEQQTNKE